MENVFAKCRQRSQPFLEACEIVTDNHLFLSLGVESMFVWLGISLGRSLDRAKKSARA
jgi:hypothetical protein